MYSREHALISLALGVAIVLAIEPPVHPALVVAVVVAVGVGIDFDHFPIALWNTGSADALRRIRRRPSIVFLEQDAIFEEGEVTESKRLLSHAVLGGVAVAGLWPLSPYWALVVALTVYVHVLADLYSDVRRRA